MCVLTGDVYCVANLEKEMGEVWVRKGERERERRGGGKLSYCRLEHVLSLPCAWDKLLDSYFLTNTYIIRHPVFSHVVSCCIVCVCA